jgi:hypothetical protein
MPSTLLRLGSAEVVAGALGRGRFLRAMYGTRHCVLAQVGAGGCGTIPHFSVATEALLLRLVAGSPTGIVLLISCKKDKPAIVKLKLSLNIAGRIDRAALAFCFV